MQATRKMNRAFVAWRDRMYSRRRGTRVASYYLWHWRPIGPRFFGLFDRWASDIDSSTWAVIMTNWLVDRVEVLRPTRRNVGHFGDAFKAAVIMNRRRTDGRTRVGLPCPEVVARPSFVMTTTTDRRRPFLSRAKFSFYRLPNNRAPTFSTSRERVVGTIVDPVYTHRG